MPNRKSINILAAPAHYLITDKIGSEFSWSYGLMKSVTDSFDVRYTAITQALPDVTQEIEKVTVKSVTSLKKPRFSSWDAFLFSWQCFLKGKKMLTEKHFDLIHHILPFKYEYSVSLLTLCGYTKKVPFIIGPLQPPAAMTGKDEIGFHSDSAISKVNKFSHRLFNFSLCICKALIKRLFAYTIKRCDALIVVNNYTRELYEKYVSPRKIKVIPPGINVEQFKCAPPLKKEEIEILSVGYLLKRKGLDYLIEAFSYLVKRHPKLKLRFVGNGPQLPVLRQLSNELEVGEKVVFQGFVPHNQLASFYQNCDICCFPSLAEGFSTVILEAMASGRPVVAAENAGSREIVIEKETGFLVPPRNSVALSKALLDLIQNKELRSRMGGKARQICETRYDWRKIGTQYYKLYKELLSKK